MARFNEILTGRYNRLMQKLLSMKGGASLVTLSDEMFAVLPLFHGVENRYLEGWDRFNLAVAISAVAGQLSQAQWRNPVGSNVIAVIEGMIITNIDVAQTYEIRQGKQTADLATVDSFTFLALDNRGRSNPTLITSHTNNVADQLAGNTILRAALVATSGMQNLIFTQNQEIPLLPGQALGFASFSNNTRIDLAVTWRERFLEDSERA